MRSPVYLPHLASSLLSLSSSTTFPSSSSCHEQRRFGAQPRAEQPSKPLGGQRVSRSPSLAFSLLLSPTLTSSLLLSPSLIFSHLLSS